MRLQLVVVLSFACRKLKNLPSILLLLNLVAPSALISLLILLLVVHREDFSLFGIAPFFLALSLFRRILLWAFSSLAHSVHKLGHFSTFMAHVLALLVIVSHNGYTTRTFTRMKISFSLETLITSVVVRIVINQVAMLMTCQLLMILSASII